MSPSLTREQSLGAKPVAALIVRREALPNGAQRITIRVETRGFMRWALRAPAFMEQQYELDALGLWVLEQCDGQKTVRHIVERFAKQHQVDEHEAERAVLTFVRTLVRKGVLTLVVAKG